LRIDFGPGQWVNGGMKKRHIALILFVILGAADFTYGVWRGDEFSMFMGCLVVVVAVSIAYREIKGSGS
jgi:hypothetical protein